MSLGKTLKVYLAADLKNFSSGMATAQGQTNSFGKSLSGMLGPALIGAGIAAAAFAVSLAVDGVQAAMAEEQELTKLNTTLDNLGFGAASAQVNTFIDDLQFATGVADSELRPAFDRLVRSTGSVGEAQRALGLALDASAGTGKSLESVASALGKAYDGNTTSLGKLGLGIDKATLASGDLSKITGVMADTFKGQSAAAADTLKGRIDILKIASDELIESFGQGLVGAADDSAVSMGKAAQAMRDAQPAARDLGNFFNGLGVEALKVFTKINILQTAFERRDLGLFFDYINAVNGNGSMEELAARVRGLGEQFNYVQYQAYGARAALMSITPEVRASSESAFRAAESNASFAGSYVAVAKSATGAGSVVKAVTEEEKALTKAFEAQKTKVDELTSGLDKKSQALETATGKIKDYYTTLAGQITSGFDLSKGFKLDEQGKADGAKWLAAAEGSAGETEWYGNVLRAIQSNGGSEELTQYLAAKGLEQGAAMGQAMLDQGLIPKFNSLLEKVQETAKTTAQAMVPEFLTAGVDQAAANVRGLAQGLKGQQANLQKIGQSIAKPIGAELKATIAEAVAAAIKAAEDAQNAASAQRAANAARNNANSTAQSTIQVLNQILADSNNRAGYYASQTAGVFN